MIQIQHILKSYLPDKFYMKLESSLMSNPTIPAWEWYSSHFVLQRVIQNKPVFWNTAPTVQLVASSQTMFTNCFSVEIKMEKNFSYDFVNGWHWHKSWIIPKIQININLNSQFVKNIEIPINSSISIYAVKPEDDDPELFYIKDVGLQGNTQIKAVVGRNHFEGLKFDTTSFKQDGLKFNLLIIIAINNSNTKDVPHILWSFISPPIFVDSRNSTRKVNCEYSIFSVYSKFDPEQFNREQFKKCKQESQLITPDFKGLMNYFKAPNIRNKIKNPFFLCYKFSDSLKLFYNSTKFANVEQIVPSCLREFRSQMQKLKVKTNYDKLRVQCDKLNTNSLLCVLVNITSVDEKKYFKDLLKKFGQIDNSLISFVFDRNIVSTKFLPLAPEVIARQYQQEYCRHRQDSIQLEEQLQENCSQYRNQRTIYEIEGVQDKWINEEQKVLPAYQQNMYGYYNIPYPFWYLQ